MWMLFFLHLVTGEWVEIVPIFNNKSDLIQTSTVSYDIFLTTPFLKDPVTSTTPNSDSLVMKTTLNVSSRSEKDNLETDATDDDYDSGEGKDNDNEDTDEHVEDKNEDNKSHYYHGFLPFLQMVQNQLLTYKFDNHKNKMSVLKHLRDNLMENIHERIAHLWMEPNKNEARGYKEDDHDVDVHSQESALMTIGFLTFAVYLIKLVIKLVVALKNKQQYNSTTTTTTAASVVFIKRKRDVDEDAARISQYIDEYEIP